MCGSCETPLVKARGWSGSRRGLMLGLASGLALVSLLGATSAQGVKAAFAGSGAASLDLPAPKPNDVCPVCGMFVAAYPHWVATILFQDGHAEHFDGGKDFFRYLLDFNKYGRGRTREQIAAMGVTDYYDTKRIDAATALFVIGSDVLGPMGHELVPHGAQEDAKEFLQDHNGRRVLSFTEVTAEMLAALDQGRFE